MTFFDAIWPEEGAHTFAPYSPGMDLEKLDKAAKENPQKKFLLLVEDFDSFGKDMPACWRRMPPEGMPHNIGVGASIGSVEDAVERIPRLIKLRAGMLYVLGKKTLDLNENGALDLSHQFHNWRCTHCGRRGKGIIPPSCPTGATCMGEEVIPQVHWIIDIGTGQAWLEGIATVLKIPYWGATKQQYPKWYGEETA